MKLLVALRQKIYEEQGKIANLLAKAVGFNSTHDSTTVIEREDAKDAWKYIAQNRQLLLDSFPKEHVKKLMSLPTIDASTDLGDILVIFKQVLRSQKARLISRKKYDWNTEQRRQSYSLQYRIISVTPQPAPTRPTPPSSTPQTSKTTIPDTNTSNITVSDTKVSTNNQELTPNVVMSAKRKLSPTPSHAQPPTPKKTKPSTPQKEQQPTPNEQVSHVKVLNASPNDTHPSTSPIPSPTLDVPTSPAAQTLSPTPEGGVEKGQVPVDVPII
tara:strand:+ start:545 stop:1357 length:813 start_codon:yes stop_codon:yes gene_type:complete